MKTHLARIAAAFLAASLALPAVGAERAQDIARLKERVAALEARVAALEEREAGAKPGSEAIDRVALLADRAMSSLVDMVRALKRNLKGEAL